MTDVTKYVVEFLLNIAAFLLALRFLLQLMRADFYNPISQSIVKITDPILKPLRLLMPGYKNLDFAALLAMVVVMALLHVAEQFIGGGYAGTVWQITLFGVYETLLLLIQIVRWSILISIIASFVAQGNGHPALMLIHELTEPVLAPVRKLLPSMGGLDFSPILVFLIIGVIEQILPQVFSALL
jgi:YggT family protein